MKDIIKNYKSVIVVYALTFAVSVGITMYYFSVKTNIEALSEKKKKIESDNTEVENYTFKVTTDENVNLRKKSSDQRLEELKKIKEERFSSYSEGLDEKADMVAILAKNKIGIKVDNLVKELRKQGISIDEKDELSFAVTRKNLLDKKGPEIQIALQQLNYIEHILKSAASAGVEKVLSINRPKDLVISAEKDSALPWEYHTFKFKFGGSPESIKKLINQLSNEKGYYTRITYVEMKGGSVTAIEPTFKYPTQAALAPTKVLSAGPEDPSLEPGKVVDTEVKVEVPVASSEPQKFPTNPLAFEKPKVEAEINVDWIIFKKDQKGK